MKYIYESPDGGKTVYRRLAFDPNAERIQIKPESICVSTLEDGSVIAFCTSDVSLSGPFHNMKT